MCDTQCIEDTEETGRKTVRDTEQQRDRVGRHIGETDGKRQRGLPGGEKK